MLKTEILEAVEKERFAIYTIKTIDEGISILTGVEAGEPDAKGKFPASSVNGKVVARIKELSETVKEFNRSKRTKSETKDQSKND